MILKQLTSTFLLPISLAVVLQNGHAGIPDAVHPDFTISQVPLPVNYQTQGIGFLKDGRMALAVIDFIGGGEVPNNPSAGAKVLLVNGYTGTEASAVKVEEISNSWLQFAGLTIANDKLYVSDRDGFYEIPELVVPADKTKNRKLIVKWPDENTWNEGGFQWHQWVFTPMFNNGFFYAPYSGCIRQGGPSDRKATSKMAGAFLKWDLTGKMETYAGGLRSPNGANWDPATGEMYVADNQGSWFPSSTFSLMKPGKFYGHRQTGNPPNWAESLPYQPPVAWLPQDAVRKSPSQPIIIPTGKYAGDWLIGDVNWSGFVRVAIDRVGEAYNGAVFFFSQGMGNSAIQRLAYGPDGALYIGTLKTVAGNWPGGDDQPMYRMSAKPTATAFEMKAVRSLADGLEIEFTQPVDSATISNSAFNAKHWQYIRESGYGNGKQAEVNLTISATELSTDKKRVHLKISGLVADRVVNIKHTGLKSGGKAAWNDESWFTLNTISTRTWSATVGIENQVAKAKFNVGDVNYRADNAGHIDVALVMDGAWNAELVTPNGESISKQSGNGSSRFLLNVNNHSGLHFLKVSSRGINQAFKILL